MVFTVLKDGIPLMRTQQVGCIYDKETLLDMQNNGYKFKLDGKAITVAKICQFVSENNNPKKINN